MKKRIYLLLPFLPREEAYSSPVGDIIDGEHVPLGIYYIAAFLRKNGYEVKVTDALALKLTQMIFSTRLKRSPHPLWVSAPPP